jgi:hypothetical protein
VPPGLAVLDAPDIDSVEERNRSLAAQLLAAADLWLFVTSAARYADQVPWDFLKQAADRSAAVAIVLDRTAAGAVDEVSSHLARMLTAAGCKDSPLFTVARARRRRRAAARPTCARSRGWLTSSPPTSTARAARGQADPRRARSARSPRTHEVADAARSRSHAGAAARDVDRAYDEAVRDIDEASADGTLLRGEVLARWQEFVGTASCSADLESKVELAARPDQPTRSRASRSRPRPGRRSRSSPACRP